MADPHRIRRRKLISVKKRTKNQVSYSDGSKNAPMAPSLDFSLSVKMHL